MYIENQKDYINFNFVLIYCSDVHHVQQDQTHWADDHGTMVLALIAVTIVMLQVINLVVVNGGSKGLNFTVHGKHGYHILFISTKSTINLIKF